MTLTSLSYESSTRSPEAQICAWYSTGQYIPTLPPVRRLLATACLDAGFNDYEQDSARPAGRKRATQLRFAHWNVLTGG
jgi:hypothetical protein